MSNDSALELAARVQRLLDKKTAGPTRPRVLSDEVQLRGEDAKLWYVPVSVLYDTEHMNLVYGAFSEVEVEMEEEGIEILLVPRIIPFQRLQDIA